MPDKPIKLFATRAERYPKPSDADTIQGTARAALSAIPLVGGPITEILSMVLAPAVVRRRDDWLKDLAHALDSLEAKVEGFKVEDLVDDESFVSAAIQASRTAIGTHQLEKREMLRTALLNIATKRGPGEELQEAFLSAVDAFLPLHVKVLNFIWKGLTELNEAGKWNALNPYALGNYSTAISELHPELKGHDELLLYIMTDLKNRGFSTISRPADSFPQNPGITNGGTVLALHHGAAEIARKLRFFARRVGSKKSDEQNPTGRPKLPLPVVKLSYPSPLRAPTELL